MGISRAYVFLLLKPLFSLNELPIAKANILIDDTGNACLVDFGLLKTLPDPANFLFSTSNVICGSTRWMSPELIDPLKFGFEKSQLTKFSDCYALGMVIYETVSGRMPFHKYSNYLVSLKVVNGERPPRGVSFPDSLWKTLELCWASQQDDRPNVEDVLQCLESSSLKWDAEMEKDFSSDLSDYSSPFQSRMSDEIGNEWTRGYLRSARVVTFVHSLLFGLPRSVRTTRGTTSFRGLFS